MWQTTNDNVNGKLPEQLYDNEINEMINKYYTH